MMTDTRNTILAVVLSGLVLLVWQYFYDVPPMEKQRAAADAGRAARRPRRSRGLRNAGAPAPQRRQRACADRPRRRANQQASRAEPRDRARREPARQDRHAAPRRQHLAQGRPHRRHLRWCNIRETVDPKSPPIVLLSPSGTADPYYAEFGWVPAAGATSNCRIQDTVWSRTAPAR